MPRNLPGYPGDTNRAASRRPRGRRGWCGCDRATVCRGQKCPACGQVEKHRTIRVSDARREPMED